ncbi:glycosyltransferase family 4 protein [Bacteroides sp. GD17]|jgi:glycosyltransferase involved in cell wall biosynthesis|uniref:glycosyltransferase family 4 protein n=1 Tax=Bacteroides sp. GD17 TaxID=3139826 RepID=UPI0025D7319D|nr:glycosyltransferase family 4 protein [uncultured Bacteroides sp.]
MMHILHISGSYGGTEVYKNLYSSLDNLGIRQTIFVPLNAANHDRIGSHYIDFKVSGSRIIYSVALKPWHRFFYKNKINVITREIEREVDLRCVDIIHASTLCMDGAVAYELKKKFDIPYLSAVRNTDISVYYKYFKWQIPYFSKVFSEAANIAFISPQYKNFYLKNFVAESKQKNVINKIVIIPNGIDALFLKKRFMAFKELSRPIKVVFASAFVRNKGLMEIINAIALLRNEGYDITLNAIGKGLPFRRENTNYIDKVEKLAEKYDWIELQNFLPKDLLREAFSQSDIYVMPSQPETFGLVYVEALSQKLPIVYGKGEGFDGYFEESFVGYAAIPFDVNDIAEKIRLVVDNYDKIIANISSLDLNNLFSWESISEKYAELYMKITVQ